MNPLLSKVTLEAVTTTSSTESNDDKEKDNLLVSPTVRLADLFWGNKPDEETSIL